jgi:uncharacterized membrane protein
MQQTLEKKERDYMIDTLKGLLLVIMALDHTSLSFVKYT